MVDRWGGASFDGNGGRGGKGGTGGGGSAKEIGFASAEDTDRFWLVRLLLELPLVGDDGRRGDDWSVEFVGAESILTVGRRGMLCWGRKPLAGTRALV